MIIIVTILILAKSIFYKDLALDLDFLDLLYLAVFERVLTANSFIGGIYSLIFKEILELLISI